MVLEFPILADYAILSVQNRRIYITHGHKINIDNPISFSQGDILVHGHTHIPVVQSFGMDNLYLNPGSVSIPKGSSKHSYMILEEDHVQWKDLDGNMFKELKL